MTLIVIYRSNLSPPVTPAGSCETFTMLNVKVDHIGLIAFRPVSVIFRGQFASMIQ